MTRHTHRPPEPAQSWADRVWREFRAGNLTRAYRDVLLTLQTYYRGAGSLICPSHATLAERVGCNVRTVLRALQLGRELGLVSWVERRVKAAWRWLRTSNSYRLHRPETPVRPGLRPPWPRRRATTGQIDRGVERKEKREEKQDARESHRRQLEGMLREAAGLPDLLKRRLKHWEGKLAS